MAAPAFSIVVLMLILAALPGKAARLPNMKPIQRSPQTSINLDAAAKNMTRTFNYAYMAAPAFPIVVLMLILATLPGKATRSHNIFY